MSNILLYWEKFLRGENFAVQPNREIFLFRGWVHIWFFAGIYLRGFSNFLKILNFSQGFIFAVRVKWYFSRNIFSRFFVEFAKYRENISSRKFLPINYMLKDWVDNVRDFKYTFFCYKQHCYCFISNVRLRCGKKSAQKGKPHLIGLIG